MSIFLMDSTIRDGGNVNGWNFGKETISGIVQNLALAKVDYIELGYLKNCRYDEDKTLYNNIEEAKRNIPANADSRHVQYSLMVQEDKWDWDHLTECDGVIKNIRVSFHKTDVKEGFELCRKVMEMGYVCHCNPINIMGYDDGELVQLVSWINEVHPAVFTIVDTFGSMSMDDMRRISSLLNKNLGKDIKISVHLHENLGLAFALAIEFIDYFESKRDILIDASLYGIGRVPGNLCIELAAKFLKDEKNCDYDTDYLYDAIDGYVAGIKKEYPWGYDLAYALSGFYNLHRTYPEYLLKKGKLQTKDIRRILERIIPERRIIYNEDYIEGLYREYVRVDADDSESRAKLRELTEGKDILIIASGESILHCKHNLTALSRRENVFVITVNFLCDFVREDVVLFTSTKRLSQFSRKQGGHVKALTSNLVNDSGGADMVFNYYDITTYGQNMVCEDGVLMLLYLFSSCNTGKICIAGFDSVFGSFKHFDRNMELSYSHPDSRTAREILKRYRNRNIEFMLEENKVIGIEELTDSDFDIRGGELDT